MAGHIISVIGGKGGVGKSMIAANLAFAYAQETRGKTLLLDFDQKAAGDLALITGMKSKKTIKDLSEFKGAIDPRSLMSFVSAPLQNVSIINIPTNQTEADQIDVNGLGKSLKAVTNIYPLTVIDVGNELNELALKALEFSTMILLVVTPDLLAVNQSRRMFNELITMLFPKEIIQVVVNSFQKGHPVSPEVIGKQIGQKPFGFIPKDEQSCIVALNKAKPILITAKNGGFAKGIVDIARRIVQKNVLKRLEAINKPKNTNAINNKNKPKTGSNSNNRNPWIELKSRIHRGLVEEIDINDNTDESDPKAMLILREQTKKIVVNLLNKEDLKGVVDGREAMNQIVKEILDEAVGLGPLEDLLADSNVSEIMVNGPFNIFYESNGKIKKSDVVFTNDHQVENVIRKIIAPLGRRIDSKTPYVDARLRDGSRVHAIIPPCSIDGCTITIRKFPENQLDYKDLIKFGSLNQNMADFLRLAVEAKKNIVISGGTGSGKTTLINILGCFIPANERIITVEDSAEISLPQEHVVRLETKPPSLEGEGAVDIRLLVKQTLRMRPDRIIVGECRGGEALDMLQAMNTGHDGSLTTVHANNARDCIGRLETLVQYSGAGITPRAIREMIASAVDLIVQQTRMDDGSRKIVGITEVSGIQGEIITTQPIFEYIQKDIDNKGKIKGSFVATGFIPTFVEKLERKGYKIPRNIFKNDD